MRTHAPAWGVLVAAFSVILVVGLGAFGVGRVMDAWVGELPSVHDPNAFTYSAKTRIYANDRTTLLAEFYLQTKNPSRRTRWATMCWKARSRRRTPGSTSMKV